MHYETRCGDLVKILWHDDTGMSLYAKRLERGRFVWPQAKDGVVSLVNQRRSGTPSELQGIY